MATAPDLGYWTPEVPEKAVLAFERSFERDYPELLNWLQTEEERAKDTTLNQQREVALKFYNGEPFGDEEPGRSQIVTRDVAEVIDYMVPSVLRTMVSGDRVVEFEALDAGFKDVLEDATEAVSQQFMQEQSGWRILHDSLKAGLLEKTGAIKSYVEEKKTRREEDVTAVQLSEMRQAGIEIMESEPVGEFAALSEEEFDALEQAAAQDPSLIEQLDQFGPMLRVAWFETSPNFVDVPVPNEELGVATDARSIEDAIYYNHRTPRTLSELKALGLDVDAIGLDDGGYGETTLSKSRNASGQDVSAVRDGPNRMVWYLEEYCRYDLNGDGLAEHLRVQRVGRQILSVEEIDYGPCEEWCPFPMPHRRVGQSLADKVMDIQRTRSVLLRQAMDNLYLSNFPRMLVSEQSLGDTTTDDLLTFLPGSLVRYKGGEAPRPLEIPFVAGNAFQAMEVLTGERESRTGITRLNQGLDADALNKTATGTALMQAQGQQIEEYIARNFAEFVGRVFGKKYRLMKDYGKPFQIIVDGTPKTVDPSQWPDQMRVVIRVGLGSGRKEQRIQHRMTMLNLQQQAAQAQDPHVGPEQIFNSVKGLVADLQLGQATDFYADPAKMQQAGTPEPEDPQLVKVREEAARKQQELEARIQEMQFKQRLSEAEAQEKARRAQEDAERRAFLEQMKVQTKAALDEARADFEARLAQQKASQEYELEQQRLQMNAVLNAVQGDARMSANRPGGSLAE